MQHLWSPGRKNRFRRKLAGVLAGGLAICTLTVAGTGISAAASRAAASKQTLTVWTDSARLPMVKLYAKTHPGVKVNIVTFDGGANGDGSIESKVALFNRIGKGWPDIIFSEEANDVQRLAAPQFDNFAAVLNKGLVPNSVLKNYAPGALSPCMVGGKLECLRNDMAFDVLWVNVPLMKQWGYTVPQTWQQWQAIGESVATNHPGYIVGTAGDSFDDSIYLQAAQCPINDVLNSYKVLDNPNDAHCTGMGKLLDPLLADKSLPVVYVFASTFGKQYADKTLMLVGPAWYSGAIFEGTGSEFNSPKGTWAAYPPLAWGSASAKAYTGDVGGGLWIMSSHAADPKLAAQAMTWLATSTPSQDLSQGYPGYVPAAKSWISEQDASGFFANPLAPTFATAVGEVWTGWAESPWDVYGLWAANVLPALASGSTFSSQIPVMATQISDAASVDGFQVVTKA
jgi:ABC-type glycerol-3-phosphate transport system substrate-binding protein